MEEEAFERDTEKFISNLTKSNEAVWFMAYWFWRRGYTVKIPRQLITPNYQSRLDFQDNGDLIISPDDIKWMRIEVKRLTWNFTGLSDWKYPDFIVCAKHSFDNALKRNDPPAFYFILSQDMKHSAIINTKVRSHWRVDTREDRRYENMVQTFYVIDPKEVNKWKKMRQ